MAKNSFNFQAKLGLETKDFKRGARDAKGILNGLQSDFRSFAASLIAGLSIGNIFDKMKDSALELSNALNTLKNVSNTNGSVLDGYATNLEFVRNLAEKYGQNILSLADSYAKFAAASRSSNMTLEDQQKIFASLTRAAGYFHLSADQTRDMMNAVIQMMSKGKVASEELRRQLGNTLPGAFQMMADAVGVSEAQLEKMMKRGEVLAEDVLPKFAVVLNQATQGGNFDNLQASINKLENAWLGFVNKSGFQDFYKRLIDWSTKGLNIVSKNSNLMKHYIIGLFGTTLLATLKNTGERAIAEMESSLSGIENRLKVFESSLKTRQKKLGESFANTHSTGSGLNYFSANGNIDSREKQRIVEMNNLLLESEKIRKRLGHTPMLTDTEVEKIEEINRQLTNTPKLVNAGTKAFKTMGIAVKSLWVTIKSIGKYLIIFELINVVISTISWGFEKIKDAILETHREQQRLNEITENYNNQIKDSISSTELEVAKGKELLKIITNQNISLAGRKEALNRLADLTGNIELKEINIENIKEGTDEYLKLADAINIWGEALKKNAYISAYAQQAAQAQVEVDKLNNELQKLKDEGYVKTVSKSFMYGGKEHTLTYDTTTDKADRKIKTRFRQLKGELETQNEILTNATNRLSEVTNDYAQLIEQYRATGNKGLGDTTTDDNNTITDLNKLYEDFLKKERELKNQLKEGAISQKQFNDEFNDLLISTWKSAAATGEMNLAELSTKSNLTALEAFYVMLARQATVAMGDISKEIIKQWEKELMDEIERMGQEIDDYFEKEVAQQNIVFDIHAGKYDAEKDTRNSLFDYKKTMSDIYGENLNITEKYIDDLEGKYKELNEKLTNVGDYSEKLTIIRQLGELQRKIKEAKDEATGFEALMNLSMLEEDIKELNKNLAVGIWDTARNIVGGLDAITQAHDNLKETLNDEKSSGWDKFVASFELLGSVIDGVIGTIETFNNVIQLSSMLTYANSKMDELSAEAKNNSTLANLLNTASEKSLNKAKMQDTISTEANTQATNANTTAKTNNAAAGAAGAAGAGLFGGGFLGKLLPGLGLGLGILGLIGLFKKSRKFASGGIVGGSSSYGDRGIARVNSGEMILNKAQQGTLWNMLNGKGGIGGNVQFKIRGADLVGTINNYNSRRRG